MGSGSESLKQALSGYSQCNFEASPSWEEATSKMECQEYDLVVSSRRSRKTDTVPKVAAAIVPENQRNAGYVIRFDFLEVSAAVTAELTWTVKSEKEKELVHEAIRDYAKHLQFRGGSPNATPAWRIN